MNNTRKIFLISLIALILAGASLILSLVAISQTSIIISPQENGKITPSPDSQLPPGGEEETSIPEELPPDEVKYPPGYPPQD